MFYFSKCYWLKHQSTEYFPMKLKKKKKNACVDVSDIASDKQPPETSTGQNIYGGVVPSECIMSQ